MNHVKHCTVCGERFEAKRADAKTCSDRCRKRLLRGHVPAVPDAVPTVPDIVAAADLAATLKQTLGAIRKAWPTLDDDQRVAIHDALASYRYFRDDHKYRDWRQIQ
jgi:hypothetical protein